jgi:hypothetical protein
MSHMSWQLALGLLLLLFVVAVRSEFLRVSKGSSVDHYYWILAAAAYREQRGFPVRIRNKYLLEDERQAYPPMFGLLLSRIPQRFLISPHAVWLVQFVDLMSLAVLCIFVWQAGFGGSAVAAIVIVYGLAPVLVAYNTQLTSRALGNLVLVVKCLAEAAAATLPVGDLATLLWCVAIVATAAVLATHKMTTQLMLVMWPAWAWSIGGAFVWFVPILGIALFRIVAGAELFNLQWLAHIDILKFWRKHWRNLGVHAFEQSPIYGNPDRPSVTVFHKPGIRGALSHARLLISYGPLLILTPATLPFSDAPPAWIITWWAAAMSMAALTLFVGPLRFLGGGHYYIFNAVAPAALWWGLVLSSNVSMETKMVFALGFAATCFSLAAGWYARSRRAGVNDEGLLAAVANLTCRAPMNVAVFPVTAAEYVAFATDHAVLWGAHGCGFENLEPIFPVVSKPLAESIITYNCRSVLFDSAYWPEGEEMLARDFSTCTSQSFGRWRLVDLGRR